MNEKHNWTFAFWWSCAHFSQLKTKHPLRKNKSQTPPNVLLLVFFWIVSWNNRSRAVDDVLHRHHNHHHHCNIWRFVREQIYEKWIWLVGTHCYCICVSKKTSNVSWIVWMRCIVIIFSFWFKLWHNKQWICNMIAAENCWKNSTPSK